MYQRAGLAAGCVAAMGLAGLVPQARAETPAVATWFDALGSPYGGCGVPQDLLETQDFVALNVYNTPGDYSSSPARPLTGADLAVIGTFDNGLNCGRWVHVTLGPMCDGTNDGAPGLPFCRGTNAQWVDDAYSGGSLDFIVADSCGDGNAWCRDNPRHLDLSKPSLDRFQKDGKVLTGLAPDHWNNRAITWDYMAAPGYTGDVRIYFLKGAMKYWPAIMVTHLPNGIHGVEQWLNGAWAPADRYSDMGQGFILKPADAFRIRLTDAADKPVFGGREYAFSMPDACGSTCGAAATVAAFTAADPGSPIRAGAAGQAFRLTVTAGGLRLTGMGGWPEKARLEARDLRGRLAWAALLDGGPDRVLPLPASLPAGLYRAVLRIGGSVVDAGLFARP